ncbi:MAG: hypothetical protein O7A66_04850 [Alphaproteobacteria bacterium]|nr:hypothetical protein [Alphaproteobacteria bacterium]
MPPTVALAPPSQPPAAVAPDSRRQVVPEDGEFKPFGEDGLTFDDVLDVINPLHHLPIIGAIYRDITGDTISAASKVTGGALFGGPIGLAVAVADTVLEESSGQDAGGHVLALMKDAQRGPDEIPSQPGGPREAPLSETVSLRHDANEYEDGWWQDPDAAAGPENVAAANQRLTSGADFKAAQTASLRHDANDNEDGWWQDPDTATGPENVAAAQRSASAAPAAASPVTGTPSRNTIGPGAALNGGPRALGAALPAPRALAANPATVTAFRKGELRYFRPGGTINSDTWLKLMSNVGANRGRNAAPTGPRGLASGTLAKALATYGAAEVTAAKAGRGLIRP